jgi:hypothetical protein
MPGAHIGGCLKPVYEVTWVTSIPVRRRHGLLTAKTLKFGVEIRRLCMRVGTAPWPRSVTRWWPPGRPPWPSLRSSHGPPAPFRPAILRARWAAGSRAGSAYGSQLAASLAGPRLERHFGRDGGDRRAACGGRLPVRHCHLADWQGDVAPDLGFNPLRYALEMAGAPLARVSHAWMCSTTTSTSTAPTPSTSKPNCAARDTARCGHLPIDQSRPKGPDSLRCEGNPRTADGNRRGNRWAEVGQRCGVVDLVITHPGSG